MRSVAFALPLVVVALSGCFADDAANACRVAATGPMFVSDSWAYDGAALRPATGAFALDVDPKANTGTASATANEGSGATSLNWEVAFTSFVGSRPFHDGGIATGLTEHGDSGVGDALIPKVRLECAGWGPVALKLNGRDIVPEDVGANLTGHFMVSSTGVRDDASGAITGLDGATPYDPERPGDARRTPGDHEFWVVVRTPPTDAPPAPDPIVFTDTVSAPTYARQWTFDVLGTADVQVAASVRSGAPGPLVGGLTVTLRDPAGGDVGSASLGGTAQTASGGITKDSATPGSYVLAVSGNGLQLTYTLTVSVTYEGGAGFLLVLFWEEGTLG